MSENTSETLSTQNVLGEAIERLSEVKERKKPGKRQRNPIKIMDIDLNAPLRTRSFLRIKTKDKENLINEENTQNNEKNNDIQKKNDSNTDDENQKDSKSNNDSSCFIEEFDDEIIEDEEYDPQSNRKRKNKKIKREILEKKIKKEKINEMKELSNVHENFLDYNLYYLLSNM